jgi:hypothetical protein
MAELNEDDAPMEEMPMDTGGDGGGGGGSPPPGTPAPTAEELIAQRDESAVALAEKLAAKYGGRQNIPQAVLDQIPAAVEKMPAPVAKRPGMFGPIIDMLFGPPF